MRTWARLTQKAGGKAYVYYFSRVPPRPDAEKYGAYHAAEVAYAFDNLRLLPWKSEPADQALAEAISGAWVRFAASGDPNGGTLASWTAYDPQREMYLELGDPIRAGSALLRAQCDFFDDFIAAAGANSFAPPEAVRSDRVFVRGVRLPFLKFPARPTLP